MVIELYFSLYCVTILEITEEKPKLAAWVRTGD